MTYNFFLSALDRVIVTITPIPFTEHLTDTLLWSEHPAASSPLSSLTTLRPVPVSLASRSARRNSPALPGIMLSCRRRDSSPAPGKHNGRIPEWHTETRTDISTVLQPARELPNPDREGDGAGGGVGAHPPELSAISLAPSRRAREMS